MKYILAIDQGTTGSRAVVYDRAGRSVASAYEEFPQYFPKPGWVEHKPEEIWQSVNNSVQKVLARVRPESIAAIGITNQRETTMVWDRTTGKPVYNAIVWQCRRTASRCDALKARKDVANYIRHVTGLPVDAYFSASKIEWILKNGQIRKENLAFGTPDTWLLWKLTGGRAHSTDFTNASRTMLFDIGRLKWDKNLTALFNIPASMLPEVKPSSGLFGHTAAIGKLPAGIPITAMVGDQQAALFGQGCFEPGTVKNTYGTGCFVLFNAGKKRPANEHGLVVTLACDAKGRPVYALEGSVFSAGSAVQWLRDGLRILDSAADSEALANSVKDTGGVYLVPAFTGLGAPYWNQNARGIITGITRGTGRAHVARAALEAMCYSTKDILLAMEKDSGIKIRSLRIDGGASKNDFLCRFQAGILGIKVIRLKTTELTALGAAYLAGLAAGCWKDSGEIKKNRTEDSIFRPVLAKAEALSLYAGWQVAVKRALVTNFSKSPAFLSDR